MLFITLGQSIAQLTERKAMGGGGVGGTAHTDLKNGGCTCVCRASDAFVGWIPTIQAEGHCLNHYLDVLLLLYD